jgi:predicted phosphoadenosine phosphosulfate sulfurtransferase
VSEQAATPKATKATKVPRTLPCFPVDTDVLTLAYQRTRHCFERYDHVYVTFSGGKDSTVLMNIALDVAKELDRLPLDVVFWDEEAIDPETIEYVERVSRRPDVNLRWMCMPVRHVNACSRTQTHWNCWNPDEKDKWVRPMPTLPCVESDLTNFPTPWKSIPELNGFLYPQDGRSHCSLIGMRAQESLRRRRSVTMRVLDNWISQINDAPWIDSCKTIYDMMTEDVWTSMSKAGWDYSTAYDTMTLMGIARHAQRVAPPFGQQPLLRLWIYAQAWPELWDKMTERVEGACAAARYANSPLYAAGAHALLVVGEDGATVDEWREEMLTTLRRWNPEVQQVLLERIEQELAYHESQYPGQPLWDVVPKDGEDCFVTRRYLLKIVKMGDIKHRLKAPEGKMGFA